MIPTALQPGNVSRVACACAAGLILSACDGAQSIFRTASAQADQVATLFLFMAAGAAVIWLIVMGVAIVAIRGGRGRGDEGLANALVIGGGVAFPVIVLAVLLGYTLPMLPGARADRPDLRIEVAGEQWWWRVTYQLDGEPVETANEVRLPAGRSAEIILTSPDVIHSFWIPALGGKVDMIPGRTTRMLLDPERQGVYRGACAEYCGESHALMAFDVHVMAPDAFDSWLAGQAAPAAAPGTDKAGQGRALFVSSGCGACHVVRGASGKGRMGPDLTHVGSRLSLAAATLPNTEKAMRDWLARTAAIKPGVHMPTFSMLAPEDIDAMASYLAGLE